MRLDDALHMKHDKWRLDDVDDDQSMEKTR